MAKNSNKKAKRDRVERLAEVKRQQRLAKTRVDPWDQSLIREREQRKNYFKHIREAMESPAFYDFHVPTDDEWSMDVKSFARAIIDQKVSLNDKKAINRLIEACRRARIVNEGDEDNIRYLKALVGISIYQWLWLRKPEEWKPKSYNKEKMFSDLLRYLFAKYDVPVFLDGAWFEEGSQGEVHKEWFMQLGNGENIRKQRGLPIPFTKKMAHNFSQAPSNLTINGAIRYAQVTAMGGDRRTVNGLMGTPLGNSFVNNEFWTSVIKFFIDNPFLDVVHYGPIYDYLNEKKFRSQGRRWIDGTLVDLGPEQPNLSMKGRDPFALLNQVQRWHRDLNNRPYGEEDYVWVTCGLAGYKREEKTAHYQITELLSSRELREEGSAMHHCVASYARSCKGGLRAIYSMVRATDVGSFRELTISVDVEQKMVSEARKRYNESPNDNDMRIMKLWCDKAGLTMSDWIGRRW